MKILAFLMLALVAAMSDYHEEIERFQQEKQAWIAHPLESPVHVAGVAALTQSETLIGSDPTAQLRSQTAGWEPIHARVFRTGDKIRLKAAQGTIYRVPSSWRYQIGRPVDLSELEGPIEETAWKVGEVFRLGSDYVGLQRHPTGPVLRLIQPRIENPRPPRFFPIDETWRMKGQIERKPPRQIQVLDTLGWKRDAWVWGKVRFSVDGKEQTLDLLLFQNPPTATSNFMLIFQDATSGKETYGACRYLYVPFKADGELWVDFNKTFNPYCAYSTEGFACPLPLPGNRLQVPVRAGELNY